VGLLGRCCSHGHRLRGCFRLEAFADELTVDETLALRYRRMSTEAPPVLVVQGRDGFLGLLDGGHRVTAARMRGDTSVPAIVIIPAPRDRHEYA
jgi:hypothetical protein